MCGEVVGQLSELFEQMYSQLGRPSIPPEKLFRALLLQVLYTVHSERLLMDELNYNLLLRWFVGLNMDDAVWDPTVFTKNRDRFPHGLRTLENNRPFDTHARVGLSRVGGLRQIKSDG
jgi:transposase